MDALGYEPGELIDLAPRRVRLFGYRAFLLAVGRNRLRKSIEPQPARQRTVASWGQRQNLRQVGLQLAEAIPLQAPMQAILP